MSRLRLDFDLVSGEERARFVKNYLKYTLTPEEQKEDEELQGYIAKYSDRDFPLPSRPSRAESEMVGNYILWGKDIDDEGKVVDNDVDKGYIEIQNKGKWNKKKTESLDGLLEQSAETGAPIESKFDAVRDEYGNTNHFRPQVKIPKANLDRDEVRRELADKKNEVLLRAFENLWLEIDYIDYVVTQYQLRHGIREKPIREELLLRLPQKYKKRGDEFAREINSHRYSKLRRLLIDKRQEQYALRDSYAPTMYSTAISDVKYYGSTGNGVAVLPMGLMGNRRIDSVIFNKSAAADAFRGSTILAIEAEIARVTKPDFTNDAAGVLDFRNIDHISLMVYSIVDLREKVDEVEGLEEKEFLSSLIKTYDFYVEYANLKEVPRYVLACKEEGLSNSEIAMTTNELFGTTYAQNYISTIFTKQVCSIISEGAALHFDTILSMPQGIGNFKKCRVCGNRLLLDDRNFNRQRSQLDGYMTKCKICNKTRR